MHIQWSHDEEEPSSRLGPTFRVKVRREPDVALDMITSLTFDGRIQLLEYVPSILAGPPGTDAPDD